MKNMAVIVVDVKSANGAAYSIPLKPQSLEKTMMHGISTRICLVRVNSIAFVGFPIAWKKFAATIWNPAKKVILNQVLIAYSPNFSSSGSWLKSDTMNLGKI